MTKVEELQTALLLFIAGQLAIANAVVLSQMPAIAAQTSTDMDNFRSRFDALRPASEES